MDIEMLDDILLDSVFDNLFDGLAPIVPDTFRDFPSIDESAFAAVLDDVDELTFHVMSFDDDYSCASAPVADAPAPVTKREAREKPAARAAPIRRPPPPRARPSEARGAGSVSVRRGGVEKTPRRYWTEEENDAFKQALKKHGTDINAIAKALGTRTSTQVRTHIQKYHARLVREYEESKRAAQKLKASKELGPTVSDAQPSTSGAVSGSSGGASSSATHRSAEAASSSFNPSEPSASPDAKPLRPAQAEAAKRSGSVCSISSSCLAAVAAAAEDPTTTPTASPQRPQPSSASAMKLVLPQPGQVIRISAASRRLAQMLGGAPLAAGGAPLGRLGRN